MNNSNIPTPHISAKENSIAKTVLMPGDPLRAKYIAENFLENPICFNEVRNMLGFTGKFKGKEVSVMGSGMGMPSIGIYSYELYNFYNVENIIRVGSAGAYYKDTEVYTILLATSAHSTSSYLKNTQNLDDTVLYPTNKINEKIIEKAKNLNLDITQAPIHSSDIFYHLDSSVFENFVRPSKAKVVEMESFALFANAKLSSKNAACILTVSDNLATGIATTAEERQNSFNKMIELALNSAIEL